MEEKNIKTQLKEKAEELIDSILKEGIQQNNIEFLEKIVDIHKDISNEEYWKEKIDMRYRNSGSYSDGSYGNYGEYSEGSYGRRGVPGTGRGRYSDGGSYGRRGVPGTGRGRYRGEEMLEDMQYSYGEYSEGREQYGADQETMESFKYMLKSFKDFFKHLEKEASSQEEVEMLKKTAKEMLEM